MDQETIVRSDKQSWLETWLETILGVVIGFILAAVGNWVYLYATGYSLSLKEITGLGLWMTVLSIGRQLCLRRLFEHIRVNKVIQRRLQWLARK